MFQFSKHAWLYMTRSTDLWRGYIFLRTSFGGKVKKLHTQPQQHPDRTPRHFNGTIPGYSDGGGHYVLSLEYYNRNRLITGPNWKLCGEQVTFKCSYQVSSYFYCPIVTFHSFPDLPPNLNPFIISHALPLPPLPSSRFPPTTSKSSAQGLRTPSFLCDPRLGRARQKPWINRHFLFWVEWFLLSEAVLALRFASPHYWYLEFHPSPAISYDPFDCAVQRSHPDFWINFLANFTTPLRCCINYKLTYATRMTSTLDWTYYVQLKSWSYVPIRRNCARLLLELWNCTWI